MNNAILRRIPAIVMGLVVVLMSTMTAATQGAPGLRQDQPIPTPTPMQASSEAETPTWIITPAPGEPNGSNLVESICGTTDDRTSSNDPAVGRFVFPRGVRLCTGWLVSNGVVLSAGHCMGFADPPTEIEFEVPASTANGTTTPSHPDNRYPVTSIDFRNDGEGNDWAVFRIAANTNTNRRAIHAQDAYYRMALPADNTPTNVTITGFGRDGPAPCFGSDSDPCPDPPPDPIPLNADHRTQQTHQGAFVRATGTTVEYRSDTQGGNSGSPVIDTNNDEVTIGIHTNGGCQDDEPNNTNLGTSFANTDLQTAIADAEGNNTVYVDRGHIVTTETGAFFRPYDTIGEGVANAVSGGTVSIVAGDYSESLTFGADGKMLTLSAPAGVVTIGN